MKKLLRIIKRLLDRTIGTPADEFFWRFRHILIDKEWAKSYITPESLNHPHRKLLINTIARYAPLESALEIGCASGPNLYLLAKKFPNANLRGIDISKQAINIGRKWLFEQNIRNVELIHGKADGLEIFADKSIDIVFTDAALIYIGPEKIKGVVREMTRIAKKAIILIEWCSEKPYSYEADHWAYNWELLFKEAGVSAIHITRLSDATWKGEWARRGCIVEALLKA